MPRPMPCLFLLCLALPLAAQEPVPVTAPPGFAVNVYAQDHLVHNAYCMTLDPAGRVVVSGPGYIRTLIDADGDGVAESFTEFASLPNSGAQGLCFDGPDLLAVGDAGLLRFRDADADGIADGPPATLWPLRTGSEHHAHAVRRGPDGWWYLIAGNQTGISAADVTSPLSPIAAPAAGVLLRFQIHAAGVSDVQVVADGLRNAYDFDFTAGGDPITYDSDGERDVSLPWYRPTRVFRLLPGSHAGWVDEGWKQPDAYPSMPQTLARLGRGSPTGVEVYRGDRFPEPYRNAAFVCDWTFGRVIALPDPDAEVPAEPIEFLTATGTAGFAPTDLITGRDGSLFVCVGGRGTSGAVLRVSYPQARGGQKPSEFSLSQHVPNNIPQPPASPQQLEHLRHQMSAPDPHTRRAALSALAGALPLPPGDGPDLRVWAADLAAALADESPNVRKLAMHVVGRLPASTATEVARRALHFGDPATVRLALGRLLRTQSVDPAAVALGLGVLGSDATPDLKFDAARLVQVALGDVGGRHSTPEPFLSYTPRLDLTTQPILCDAIAAEVVAVFPTDAPELDAELVRILAMLASPKSEVTTALLAGVTVASDPTDDLHRLFALARSPAIRDAHTTATTAAALLGLDAKLVQRGRNRDNNWGDRLSVLFDALVAADPALPTALVQDADFGRPAHAVYLKNLPTGLKQQAAAALIRTTEGQADYPWTSAAVGALAADATPAVRALLRDLASNPTLFDAAVEVLAQQPEPQDRALFVAALDSVQLAVIRQALAALAVLPPSQEPSELRALLTLLRRPDRDPRELVLRDRAAEVLARNLSQDFGYASGKQNQAPQREALARATAAVAAIAPAAVPADDDAEMAQQITAMLSAKPPIAGDAGRGHVLYAAKACNRCHDGGTVGPDLAGVTGRFSRADLFRSIAEPDADIPARYRGTLIVTTAGKIVAGLVVYESADGVLLKNADAQTVRVATADIESRRLMDVSLMPRGLLRGLSVADLADLEAYLKTLGK